MMEQNKIVDSLMKRFGKKIAFKNLPLESKLALIWYMALDGEAWDLINEVGDAEFNWGGTHEIVRSSKKQNEYKKFLADNIAWFDKKYGKLKFGYILAPRHEFEKSLLENFQLNDDCKEYKTIKDFLGECEKGGYLAIHKQSTWPVILSSFKDELLQDGWHRMYDYLNRKIEIIPCIHYLDEVTYTDKY